MTFKGSCGGPTPVDIGLKEAHMIDDLVVVGSKSKQPFALSLTHHLEKSCTEHVIKL